MSGKESVFSVKGSCTATDSLYLNSKFADVTFVIDGERLPAHRNILAAQNEYFFGMLFGGLRESNEQEIELHVPVEAFKLILKFLYTKEVELPFKDSNNELNLDPLIEILALANEYGVTDIVDGVARAMADGISLDNALILLKCAELYGLKLFTADCYDIIDKNAPNILQQKAFVELTKDLLISLLKRDSFSAPENEIFMAVLEWQKQNSATDLKLLLPYVRFSLLKPDFILKTVKPLKIFEDHEIFGMIEKVYNASEHENKRTFSVQHALGYCGLADPRHCERIFCAEKILPDMDMPDNLQIDLGGNYRFNYIRFLIDQSAVKNMPRFISLNVYTSSDYRNWKIHTYYEDVPVTLQHFTFEACKARGVRIDFDGCEACPLLNFEILNAKKWQICNAATEAMGASLIAGVPMNGHNLLATGPFDAAIQAEKMAYTKGPITVELNCVWKISKIRARFLTKPKKFKMTLTDGGGYRTGDYAPTLMERTLDFDLETPKWVQYIQLYGDPIECTHFECFGTKEEY